MLADLERFAPRHSDVDDEKIAASFRTALAEQGDRILLNHAVNSHPLRLAHFMAQIGHETGKFTITEESMRYSAGGIVNTFGRGKHSAGVTLEEALAFCDTSRADRSKKGWEFKVFVRKDMQEAFADRVYGPGNPSKARELGNTRKGDGYRYRGRGLMQVTGRNDYIRYGKAIGQDLDNNPDLAAEPAISIEIAALELQAKKCNAFADANDVNEVTRLINGGYNGLDKRQRLLHDAWTIWGGGSPIGPRQIPPGCLLVGHESPKVGELQKALRDAGFLDRHETIDNRFGPKTERCMLAFQAAKGLTADGMVTDEVWAKLREHLAAGQQVANAGTGSRLERLETAAAEPAGMPGPVPTRASDAAPTPAARAGWTEAVKLAAVLLAVAALAWLVLTYSGTAGASLPALIVALVAVLAFVLSA